MPLLTLFTWNFHQGCYSFKTLDKDGGWGKIVEGRCCLVKCLPWLEDRGPSGKETHRKKVHDNLNCRIMMEDGWMNFIRTSPWTEIHRRVWTWRGGWSHNEVLLNHIDGWWSWVHNKSQGQVAYHILGMVSHSMLLPHMGDNFARKGGLRNSS